MQIRDWFILIFTFLVGGLSGFYLYITNFKPNYVSEEIPSEVNQGDLNIIGLEYVGTSVSPASFRIKASGEYDYIARNSYDGEKVAGEIPDKLFDSLKNEIKESDLDDLSQVSTGNNENVICAGGNIDTNYEYNILYQENEYTLDTCVTNFSNSHPLGKIFLQLWKYMESPNEFKISVSNSSDVESSGSSDSKRNSAWSLRNYFENGFKQSGFDDN